MRLAGAPISWGVCEVPDWGVQLPPERVLAEMAQLKLEATEAGPPGFLPDDAAGARAVLAEHGLALVGGFVTAVLHDPARLPTQLADVDLRARWLAECGAEVLVLAAAGGQDGYSRSLDLDDRGWEHLLEGMDQVGEIAAKRGLALAVHPHWGTAIETKIQVDRFLGSSSHPLCLDTGHLALGGADPYEIAERIGDRVRHVHLKDVDGELAAAVREGTVDYADAVRRGLFRALGEGTARIGEVLELLRDRGYAGWYVLEQDVMHASAPEGTPAAIRENIEYARAHA